MYLTDYWLLALKITLVATNDENNTEPDYCSDSYKRVAELRIHSLEYMLYVFVFVLCEIFRFVKRKVYAIRRDQRM